MKESKDLPKDLPSFEHEFEIEVEGNLTRKAYRGDFKYRIPTLRERGQSDVYRAKLNGNLEERSLDPIIANLHYQIGYLRHAIVEAPDWWSKADYGYALRDYNVIEEVYQKCMAYESEWMLKVWGPKEKADDGNEEEVEAKGA